MLGTVVQWVLPKDKPSEAEGRLRKHESHEVQTQTLPSPVLTPVLASGAKQEHTPTAGCWTGPSQDSGQRAPPRRAQQPALPLRHGVMPSHATCRLL